MREQKEKERGSSPKYMTFQRQLNQPVPKIKKEFGSWEVG